MRSWLKKIWFILTVDCEQSAFLVSQSFDRELNFSEWLAVQLHCMICGKSRKLKKQLTALDDQLRKTTEISSLNEQFRLSEEASQRIKQKLSRQS